MSNGRGVAYKPVQCHLGNMEDTVCNVFPECGDKIEKLIHKKLSLQCENLKYVLVTSSGMYDKIELNYDDEVMKQQHSNELIENIQCTGEIFFIEYIGQQEAFPDAGFYIFVHREDVLEVEPYVEEEVFALLISQEEFDNPIKYEFRRRED